MRKKQYKPSNHRGLQVITLCISTAMVLILLGLVIFSVLMGRNLSSYVKGESRGTGNARTGYD